MVQWRGVPVALALVAVVGLGLGAATVDTAVGTDAEAGGDNPLVTEGFGEGGDAMPEVPLWAFAAVYVAGLLVGGYAVYRIYGVELYLLLVAGFVFTVVVLAVLEPTAADGVVPTGDPPATPDPAEEGGDAGGDPADSPVVLYVLVIGTAAILWLAYLFVDREPEGSTEADEADEETADTDDTLSAVGRTAGEAADRIDGQASADNAVYRAWREMTAHLDVDPRRGTPREFADAAVEAGMDPEDVATLTDAFEEVRYGDAPITDERAEAATRALRRIERAYAGGGDRRDHSRDGSEGFEAGDPAGGGA